MQNHPQPTPNAPLTYRYDETNDVHTFHFHESSARAINAWLDEMERIYTDIRAEDHVRIWMDITESGVLPVSYALNRSWQWMNNLDVHPTARMVFIHKPDMLMRLADQMFRTLRISHLQTRFFTAANQDAARAWLLASQADSATR
jgi:hypothetical protein